MKKLILTLALGVLAVGLMAGDTGTAKKKDPKAAPAKAACCGEKADPAKGAATACTMKQNTTATACPMKAAACCKAKQMAAAKSTKVLMSPKAAADAGK